MSAFNNATMVVDSHGPLWFVGDDPSESDTWVCGMAGLASTDEKLQMHDYTELADTFLVRFRTIRERKEYTRVVTKLLQEIYE